MAINKAKREEVHAKYKRRCAYCGEEITYKQMQVDHIIPQRNYSQIHKCLIDGVTKVEDYGVDDIQNLNPSCRVCNLWKSTYDLELFRSEIAAQVERLRLRSSNFRIAEKYGLVEEKNKPVKFYYEEFNLVNRVEK